MYYNVALEAWAQPRFGGWFDWDKPDSGPVLVSYKPSPVSMDPLSNQVDML
jgi:hypothetical protein